MAVKKRAVWFSDEDWAVFTQAAEQRELSISALIRETLFGPTEARITKLNEKVITREQAEEALGVDVQPVKDLIATGKVRPQIVDPTFNSRGSRPAPKKG